MIKYLEDALDFYLGEKNMPDFGVVAGSEGDVTADDPESSESFNESRNTPFGYSRPEAKIWKLIDKWKKEGLSPKFEICAKMLKLWGVNDE